MIILNATGQTCNKMFIYSNYFAESMESGEKIVILSPDITIKDYPNLQNSGIIRFPFYSSRIAKLFGYKNYINGLRNILGNKYSLKLFALSFKLVPSVNFINAPIGAFKSSNRLKHRGALKNIFTPDSKITGEVESVFNKAKETHDLVCGVHIRRGDYREWLDGKYFYTDEQYHSLMLNFKKIFPDRSVAFFLSSNERIDLSAFPECDCFSVPNGSATKDLHGLSISDYIFGPPSTFTGWASFYGETPLCYIEKPEEELSLSSFRNILEIWN
ncbi:hypothetical protein GM418_09720 [Maribellus comscasis]|uniref:L-Fucosyltransferase n=1 Tax=Maribellus comscasis TaxID=2681766 RepID=A0A6I6K1Z8_9BACT|nr:hypothetical protein [Maribellus comscasis]QGY43924.1 hypothetical protein GM418_09720 [Maribellus comscasis]